MPQNVSDFAIMGHELHPAVNFYEDQPVEALFKCEVLQRKVHGLIELRKAHSHLSNRLASHCFSPRAVRDYVHIGVCRLTLSSWVFYAGTLRGGWRRSAGTAHSREIF